MSLRDPPFGTSAKGGPRGSTPPSDLELMLWVDGELDAERASEIEALVKNDARARAVVFAMKHGSQVLSSDALRLAEAHDADNIADNVMDVIEGEASRRFMAPVRRAPAWRGPAFASAGLAVLAAAAWMLILSPARVRGPLAEGTSAPASEAPQATESAAVAGVSIDVVDFGGRPGTIFYVPAEDESMLPVVWLTEDDTPSSGDSL